MAIGAAIDASFFCLGKAALSHLRTFFWRPSFKASRDFMAWLEGLAGDQTVATLPQSEAFVQAGAAGRSMVEFD